MSAPIEQAHPHFARLWLAAALNQAHPALPVLSRVAARLKQGQLHVHHDDPHWQVAAGQAVDALVSKAGLFSEVNERLRLAITALRQGVQVLPQEGLGAASRETLWDYYQRHENLHVACASAGWPFVLAEQAAQPLSARLADYAQGEELSFLAAPETMTADQSEEYSLLVLAGRLQAGERIDQLAPALEDHYRRFHHRRVFHPQGLAAFADVAEEVTALAKRVPSAAAQALAITEAIEVASARRQAIAKTLADDEAVPALFAAYREAFWLKHERRDAHLYSFARFLPIAREIAARLQVDESTLAWMLPNEVRDGLLHGKPAQDDVSARASGAMVDVTADGVAFRLLAGGDVVDSEESARPYSNDIRGQTACRGYGRGPVHVIRTEEDVEMMPEGAVMVMERASPEFTSAFSRAAAVVCDQGGITSHAAIIAREYKVPCVVAAKRATLVLRTGMIVEVDANRGLVRPV